MRFQNALATLLLTLSCAERIDARQRLRFRQENNDAPATTTSAPESTATSDASTTSPASTSGSSSDDNSRTSVASSTGSQRPDVTSPITPSGTVTDDLTTSTSTPLPGFNSTVAPGDLPLQPKLNPALGIAGVLLMISGLGLGFVGIKHKATQTFLSTALLVALGIEVLVIYLMHPPVPVAVQAAYLIAGVAGGAIMGGLSLIFKEVCEGFGCVLGGFCFAMWLMVLSPGGLIKNNTGMIILIAILCVAGYCSYISRFTRTYAVIFCTAFAGSTAFVLGIDCFSQAGLKEFWLYVWDLNDNEFPLFTDTYPINRPMRAEIAAIIIVAFLGVMSQIKIWKIVREQKAKHDAQRIEDEEARDALEEEVGRDVESRNRRSLDHWEGHYDDKKQASVHVDSGFASLEDIAEEEHGHNSYPLVSVSSSGKDSKKELKRQSSSSFYNLRQSLTPSLPPLAFGSDDHGEDTKAILNEYTHAAASDTWGASTDAIIPVTEPASPALRRPESVAVKDRRGLNLKRLSIRSLRSKDAPTPSPKPSPSVVPEPEPETPWIEEDEDDLASSIAATAADPPDADALSVRLSRPNSMYLSFASPAAMPSRESIIEVDDEALNLGPSSTHAGLSPHLSVPRSPGQGSYFGEKAQESESDKMELVDRLPKKMSKVALTYRTNEWAKAISAAEPEPIEEELINDPEAVQIEMGDAAEAARAKQNNAAPAPPPPPPEAKEVTEAKEVKEAERPQAERRKSTNATKRMSTGPLTPIYAHAQKPSDDSWSMPLGKRTSGHPVLVVDSAQPVEAQRNVSAPILDQVMVDSPIDNSPVQQRPASQLQKNSRISSGSHMRPDSLMPRTMSQRSLTPSNLLDERRERMDNRLTTTSFMAPVPESTPATSEQSREGSLSDSQQNKSSNTSQSGEDMTLAEHKALVQQQTQSQQPTTIINPFQDIPPQPQATTNAPTRKPSHQTRPPTRPVRLSSTDTYDPHLPRRASSHNATKAAVNWSQWRSSQAIASTSRTQLVSTDSQMDMLKAARAQVDLEARERERKERERQSRMEQHMRMGGMNNAHRAALAKMQGEVKK